MSELALGVLRDEDAVFTIEPEPPISVTSKLDSLVRLDGLNLSNSDVSGVNVDAETGNVRNVAVILAIRVLRWYLRPDVVLAREQDRKEHPMQFWSKLAPLHRKRMVDWHKCDYCFENHWCVCHEPDETPRDRAICEECFNDHVSV